jgi:hypothetical protein
MARCGAGRRGQHEHDREIFHRRLLAQRDHPGRTPIEQARRLLAGEGDGLRPVAPHLFPERRNIDREGEGLMVHSCAQFAQIGEADAELQQLRKFMRRVPARRDADLVDRAPEAIAGMGVVMAEVSGSLARGRADEDEAQVVCKLVGEFFQTGGQPFCNQRDRFRFYVRRCARWNEVIALAWDASTLTTVASAIAAWIALVLSIINVRTSRGALRLAEQQEHRRKPSLVIYLQEGLVSPSPQRDARVYAFLLSVSNRSDNNNSVAEATLHLTYSKSQGSKLTVKFVATMEVPAPFQRGQASLPIPVRIDAHQTISGWYFFRVDNEILHSARVECTIVVLGDTHGNEVAIEPMILREYFDENNKPSDKENIP